MTIARDRLKLRDFTPLDHELDAARNLDELTGRFAIDDAGRIVKLYIRDKLTDHHINLVLALTNLRLYTSFIHPDAAAGTSDAGMTSLISHPSMVEITYQGNKLLTGAFSQALRTHSSVKRIGVPYCPIDDAGLAFARDCSVTHISIRGSRVSDASVATLWQCVLFRKFMLNKRKLRGMARTDCDNRCQAVGSTCWTDPTTDNPRIHRRTGGQLPRKDRQLPVPADPVRSPPENHMYEH